MLEMRRFQLDTVVSDHNYREVPENVEVETADCRVFQ